jgi:hypothetical protein
MPDLPKCCQQAVRLKFGSNNRGQSNLKTASATNPEDEVGFLVERPTRQDQRVNSGTSSVVEE